MKIFDFYLEGWTKIVISFNWIAIILPLVLILGIYLLIRLIYTNLCLKSIVIEEATIGIGSSSVTIKYDGRVREIAYKIWIELMTRKIGIMFDDDNDVITEVYNSWHDAFKVIRALLEEVPTDRLNDAKGLIEVTTKVLNNGLRPHLTKWQAKFRKWYNKELEENAELSPQEIQQKYCSYQELVKEIKEIKETNKLVLNYANELKKIVDAK